MSSSVSSWSNSKLRLRDICGWAFQREIILGHEREPNPALVGGSNAHDAIKMFVHEVLADGLIDIRSIARRAAGGAPGGMADLLPILEIMQESLVEEPVPIRPKNVILVEERLVMDLNLSDGSHAIFDGMPDLVSAERKRCTIEDWKTHWRPLTQDDFEADSQLPRYALLVAANHQGFEEFVLRMRFVRYRGAIREVTLTRQDLEIVRWELIQAIEDAEVRADFEATPGDWCNLCGHTSNCPVVRRFLAHGVQLTVANDEEARRAAEVVRAIDAHSASLKRKLKGFLGADHPTGRVQLSGGTYGFGPQQRRTAHTKDVIEVWEAFDRPQNNHVLRVDVDELKRSLDREPGALRVAMDAVVDEFEIPHCRYRRGDALLEDESESEET